MRWTVRLLPLLSLPLLFACAEPEEAAVTGDVDAAVDAAPAADPAALRQELQAVNQQFADAFNREGVPAFTRVYTDDATIYPPDMEPIRGREGITRYWQAGYDQMGIRNLRLTTDEVESMGDTAWETGRASFDTGQGPANAKYIVVWKRTPEGWRWHRDIWNMNPPAAAPAS